MATGIQVVFDCADPDSMARFWAEVIGYKLQDPPTGYGSWEHWAWNDASAVDPDNRGPRLYFQRVLRQDHEEPRAPGPQRWRRPLAAVRASPTDRVADADLIIDSRH